MMLYACVWGIAFYRVAESKKWHYERQIHRKEKTIG
jgi:hypothetical protein